MKNPMQQHGINRRAEQPLAPALGFNRAVSLRDYL